MNGKRYLKVILLTLIFLNSCTKDDQFDPRALDYTLQSVPTLTTNPITSVTQNSGVSGGKILSEGGATVTAFGICWSTHPSPTISDDKTNDGVGLSNFSSNMSNLAMG